MLHPPTPPKTPAPSPTFGSPDFPQFLLASKPKLGGFTGPFCRPGKEGLAQEQGEVTGIIIALQLQQNCSLTAIWLSIPPCFQHFKVPGDFLPTPWFGLLTKSGYSEDGGPGGFKQENVVTTLAAGTVLRALPCRGLVKIFIACQSPRDPGTATSRLADGGQGTRIYV